MAVKQKSKYTTISIGMGIAEAIDELIQKTSFWPSRGAFVREATIEKIKKERDELRKCGENKR